MIDDIGIDIGVRRISYAWPVREQIGTLDLGKSKRERYYQLGELEGWLAAQIPPSVQLWMETPFVSGGHASNRTTSLAMAELQGVIQVASDWEYQPKLVVPGTWKKELIGNGAADKNEIADWLMVNQQPLFELCENQDEIDACCIGLYGILRTRGLVDPPVKKSRKKKALAH